MFSSGDLIREMFIFFQSRDKGRNRFYFQPLPVFTLYEKHLLWKLENVNNYHHTFHFISFVWVTVEQKVNCDTSWESDDNSDYCSQKRNSARSTLAMNIVWKWLYLKQQSMLSKLKKHILTQWPMLIRSKQMDSSNKNGRFIGQFRLISYTSWKALLQENWLTYTTYIRYLNLPVCEEYVPDHQFRCHCCSKPWM